MVGRLVSSSAQIPLPCRIECRRNTSSKRRTPVIPRNRKGNVNNILTTSCLFNILLIKLSIILGHIRLRLPVVECRFSPTAIL